MYSRLSYINLVNGMWIEDIWENWAEIKSFGNLENDNCFIRYNEG